MSFLDQYVSKHRLDKLPEKYKESLRRLEDEIVDKVEKISADQSFDSLLQQYGPLMSDIIERFANYLANMPPWSLNSVWNLFRFVGTISIEVHQLVQQMLAKHLPADMSEDEKHRVKVNFGKELVYFVWQVVDPLKDYFNWLPGKQWLVKKVVMWLAQMALENVVDLFATGALSLDQVTPLSANTPSLILAIPVMDKHGT